MHIIILLQELQKIKEPYEFLQDLTENLVENVEAYVLEQDAKKNPPATSSQDQNKQQTGSENITITSFMNVLSVKNTTQKYLKNNNAINSASVKGIRKRDGGLCVKRYLLGALDKTKIKEAPEVCT